jgi:hypothetical protein
MNTSMIIIGGINEKNDDLSDLWELDTGLK